MFPKFYSILMLPVGRCNLSEFLHSFRSNSMDISKDNIMRWTLCLANGLAYIHSQNIRHEDIKPDNNIISGSAILLTDFSSSRGFETGETSTEATCSASKIYAAPELLNADGSWSYGRHGLGTDVFSLGLVFLEMIAVTTGGTLEGFKHHCRSLVKKKLSIRALRHRTLLSSNGGYAFLGALPLRGRFL
jgi:serine/threonine protein kinase